MKITQRIILFFLICLCLAAGCQNPSDVNNPLSTDVKPDALWQACKAELISRGFNIDFQNRTAGIIETRPLVGKQWFEMWKDDSVTAESVAKNSMQTTRRTIVINIDFSRVPKQVECIANVDKIYIVPENKSDSTKTDDVFIASSRLLRKRDTQGSQYWDFAGRDKDLEQSILKSIQLRLSDPE